MNTACELEYRIAKLQNLISEKKARLSKIVDQIELYDDNISAINDRCYIKWKPRHTNEFGTLIEGSYRVVNVDL